MTRGFLQVRSGSSARWRGPIRTRSAAAVQEAGELLEKLKAPFATEFEIRNKNSPATPLLGSVKVKFPDTNVVFEQTVDTLCDGVFQTHRNQTALHDLYTHSEKPRIMLPLDTRQRSPAAGDRSATHA